MEENTKMVEAQPTASERFANKIIAEFNGTSPQEITFSEHQKILIAGYFIGVDKALKTAEINRINKNERNRDHKYDNNVPCTWDKVNMRNLAIDVVNCSKQGYDMTQPNHINAIPYKNNQTGLYDIGFIPGYVGLGVRAKKYAVEVPINVTTELVYSTDEFTPLKKDSGNAYDSYRFRINNPFDRGTVVGGFGYIEYENPAKNTLVIMSLKDILKRKPKYASVEFWGGEKKDSNGNTVEVEGWYDEMCLKTLRRCVYSEKYIPIDPDKIDSLYLHQKERIEEFKNAVEMENRQDLLADANVIDVPLTTVTEEIPESEQTEDIEDELP